MEERKGKRHIRRILKSAGAAFMAACLIPMPVPVSASGTVSGIMPGTEGISSPTTAPSDYIYYGTYNNSPVKWRVLDAEHTNTGADGMFLLSEECLGTGQRGDLYFDQASPYSTAYQGSDTQKWCADFYEGNLSSQEQSAILATTKDDDAYTTSDGAFHSADSKNILNGDKVFFLSAEEAENEKYGFVGNEARKASYNGKDGEWWLRSPDVSSDPSAGIIYISGAVRSSHVGYDFAARPAFNLDVKSVLFTSAAEGGKVSSQGENGIFEIPEYTGNEWKLTLLDKSRSSFEAETTAKNENIFTVSYKNAVTGANEYLSVLIADENGAYTHYGRVLQLDGAVNGAEGTVDIDLAGIDMDGKTCYVFNEHYNGGGKDDTMLTDYASSLMAVDTAPVVDAETPVINVQPENGGYKVGDSPKALLVEASVTDGGSLSYQWYNNTEDSSQGGQPIEGATEKTFTPSADTVGTTYYYCVVTNTNDSVNGNKAVSSTSKTAAVSVGKGTAFVEVSMMGWTYGGPAGQPDVTYNGISAAPDKVEYKDAGADDSTYTADVPVNAGDYTVRVSFYATETYEAGTDTADFTIAKKSIAKPTADTTVFTYNGKEQTYMPDGFDSSIMNIENNVHTDVNTNGYIVTVTLKDTANYEWDADKNTDPTFAFVIRKAEQTPPNKDEDTDVSESPAPSAPGKDETKAPQTGDNSKTVQWFVLAFASAIGLAGAAVSFRKRKTD